ncbi:hypothetical protein KP509_02G058300 [Ceratopteris richardii]|uniref:Uncharacterized protein n=1 Tax=Ceratopteris richardii TaxID=49495 RepID=A0A8T2VHN5_CERRI|nr:hypothetical protein KP509_02G058300 [Ceratopteris richardii]
MKRGLNRRFSQRKRTRTSTSGCVAVPNDHGQAGLIVTRSGKAYSHRKEHAEVQPSDLAYTRSQAAASSCIHESIDALQGTKRKRAEKHQRGISRSKKIRRT